MKKLAIIMCCASSVVWAESRVLPPVIDNSTYSAGSAQNVSTPSNHAIYEVLGRLEQLQHELQQLRGVVEEQSQTIIDLKKRQGNIYSDLDLRLQELAGVDVSASKSQPVTSKQYVEMAVDSPMAEAVSKQEVIELPMPATNATTDTSIVDNSVAKSAANENEVYQAAYETLRNGHNTRAIAAFKSLLAEFPEGEYADNAQYWLGEAYKVNQQIDSAKVAFTKVVTQYAGSPKVPDALLKLAYIELEQKNMAKARDYLTQITVSHPATTAAHLAGKKLMSMDVGLP